MRQTKLQKTVELANLALDIAKESLWINEWTTNYEIMKMWRNKRHIPQFQCYT